MKAGSTRRAEAASTHWRAVVAAILGDAGPEVLACMTFPKEHRAKLHTNPIERLSGEIKRCTDVRRVGLRPPEGRLWHLPERRRHRPPRRRAAARTDRRMGRPARPRPSRWKASASRAMIPSSACQPRPADQPGSAGERGDQGRQLHRSSGHDPRCPTCIAPATAAHDVRMTRDDLLCVPASLHLRCATSRPFYVARAIGGKMGSHSLEYVAIRSLPTPL